MLAFVHLEAGQRLDGANLRFVAQHLQLHTPDVDDSFDTCAGRLLGGSGHCGRLGVRPLWETL